MRRRHGQAGFSIIEILITVGVASLISLAILNAINNSGEAAASADKITAQNQEIRAAMATIKQGLQFSAQPLYLVSWCRFAGAGSGSTDFPLAAETTQGQRPCLSDALRQVNSLSSPAVPDYGVSGKVVNPSAPRTVWGDRIDYLRVDQTEDGGQIFRLERLQYNGADAPRRDLQNTITLQSFIYGKSSSDEDRPVTDPNVYFRPDASGENPLDKANPKVLLRNVIAPTDNKPLFSFRISVTESISPTYFDRQENPPVERVRPFLDQKQFRTNGSGVVEEVGDQPIGWQQQIRLINVILRKDIDGPFDNSPPSDLDGETVYKPVELTSTIYLNRAKRAQGSEALVC